MLFKQVGRQNGGARPGRDLAVNLVQSGEAKLGVKVRGIKHHIGEIMRELRLFEKIIQQTDDLVGLPDKTFVFDDDDPLRMLAIAGFAQGGPCKADQPAGESLLKY